MSLWRFETQPVRANSASSGEGGRWWPSTFGSDDQIGMLNRITDAKRLGALQSVREGRIYDLGRVLEESVPVFPGRYFRQSLVTTAHHVNARHGGGLGDNRVNWMIENVSGTQQLGTHIDALSHLQIGERGYNGWSAADLAEDWGVNRLGAETIPQIVTRGFLVNVPSVRGSRSLESGDVITVDDIEGALGGRGVDPGDAVLFHTGWGRHWEAGETYLSGEPGPGYEVAEWLVEQEVALTGCDTWSYGPVPSEDPDRPFEVPQMLNDRHGVFIVENLDTSSLVLDGIDEFALILTHPKLRGATGAWCSPIALV